MNIRGKIINYKYTVGSQIGEDRMSVHYLARDLAKKNAPILIKFLKPSVISKKVEDIIRFRMEMSAVSEITHENIMKVYDVGEALDQNYLAMEYLQCQSLPEVLADGALPISKGVDIIMQVCRALEHVHARSIIHKDIKPDNIYLHDGTAKVAGFGFYHIREFDKTVKQADIINTFEHIAPEQCGMIKRGVDERTDLYSLGIVFYRMATGRAPFSGEDIFSIIHGQMAQVPRVPSSINPDIPLIIDRIIMKLLEKEPENRYQSAAGLLSDLERYAGNQLEFMLGLNDRSAKLSFRTKMIGRVNELINLVTVVDQTLDGNGGVFFVTGEAGSGKTRLIEELKSSVYSRRGMLIDGKCSVQSNKAPYQPFREALNSFLMHFANYPELEQKQVIENIREEFGSLGEILIRLSADMKEILGVCPPLVPLEPERENKRFHMVISQFLLKLSDLMNGLVIVIDDLQWTDEGTLSLLTEISEEITRHSLSVICVYRDDEAAGAPGLKKFLKSIQESSIHFEEIHLGLFDHRYMNRFISGLIMEPEDNTIALTDFVQAKSKGNPFFAIEILKDLIEEQVLAYKDNRWHFNISALDRLDISDSIVDIILKRVEKLDEHEKDILSSAAVIGDRFSINLLSRLSDLDKVDVVRIVDKAIDLQLLVELPGQVEIGFAHDRIKEAFYDSLSRESRKRLHLAIADAIEEENQDDLEKVMFDLAHHFIEAGEPERSIMFAYPAGVLALKKFANEEALKYFGVALELLEKDKNQAHARNQEIKVLAGMGKVYLNTGDYDQAIEIFRKLFPLMTTDVDKMEVYSNICDAYYKKGDWKKCEEYGRLGLGIINEHIPENRAALVLRIAWEFVVHVFHDAFPGRYAVARRDVDAKWNLLGRLALALTWSYVLSDILKFLLLTLRALNVAERRIGRSMETAMAMGGYATMLSAIPMFERSMRHQERALAMREEVNDRWGVAQSLQWIGFCHQWKADYHKALEYYRESAQIFKKIGDVREYGMSVFGAFHSHYFLADYAASREAGGEYFRIISKSNDSYGISVYWAWMAKGFMEGGDFESAESCGMNSFQISRDAGVWFVNCEVNIVLGELYLEKGEIEKSLKYLNAARELYEKNNFLKPYTVQLYPLLAEAMIAEYGTLDETTAGRKKAHMKKIRGMCRKAMARTRKWSAYRGMSLLASAKYCALAEKNRKAEKLFMAAIEHSQMNGRRYVLARCYYEYGLFLSQSDDARKTRNCMEMAYRMFREIHSKVYIKRIQGFLGIDELTVESTSIERLIDSERMASVIGLAREIGQISDFEELLATTLSKAVGITGAQRGCIFIENDEHVLEKKPAASVGEPPVVMGRYALNIVRHVFSENRHVVIENAATDERFPEDGDVLRGGLKSVLCVPIIEQDKVIGVCYLDNLLASGVFTEKEADILLAFLSNVAYAIEIELLHRRFEGSAGGGRKLLVSSLPTDKIKAAMEYINQNYTSDISREGLAAHIGIHHDNLGKYFKMYFGKKMNDYINELRVKDAARLLKDTEDKIIDIAFSVGFGSLRTFNKAFRQFMKISPVSYRKHISR
ncbi:MAG: AAA family ATPase [Spirochaetes bacterium]|nr:AAA family ATPase [Spirochaetota bacterium]